MTRDPKYDDGTESAEPSALTDPTSDTARRRKLAPSLLKTATPLSTDRSLDAFIARANEELVDLASAPFRPERREELLLRELDELKAKLAKVEARAAAAETRAASAEVGAAALEARAASSRGSRLGLTIAAFLIGGAAMFAVSFVLPGKDAAVATSAPGVTSPVETSPVVTSPVVTSPTVTPIAPAPTGITVQPIPEPAPVPQPPVPETAAKVADPTPPPPMPEKVTKKPAGKPGTRPPAAQQDPATAPKPPEDDLYNPF